MTVDARVTLTKSAHVDTFTRDHLPPVETWPTLEFESPLVTLPDRLNAAGELIDRACALYGLSATALRTPDGASWTFGELLDRSNRIAEFLVEDMGLVPGNRVLLRSPNNPWTVAAWLAVLKTGAVAVTTFSALRARDLLPIVDKTQPTVALVDHRYTDELPDVQRAHPGMRVVAYGGSAPDDLTTRIKHKTGKFDNVDTAADDVALLCATSGSTGTPKITMHFHRDVLSIDNTFGQHTLRLTPTDVVVCTAPFAFTFGLGMLVVFPLRAGATALLVEAQTPVQLVDTIVQAGDVTMLATAPTAFKQIIRAGRLSSLRELRAAVSAGEHISPHTWQQIHDELGLKVIDGIGGTELLHIFISAADDEIRPGSTGRVVPGYRAAILGPDGAELPPGVPGRLAVIGPVGCRYLDDPRQTDYVIGGWNVTGDTFIRDEDGYFWYQARTDAMIVSSGYNIGGPEVEAALDEHPDVIESAVVARPDPDRGAIVCAFVVLRHGVPTDSATTKRLQDHVKANLAPFKYPREIRFVPTLPRNTSGKLQHFKLRAQLDREAAARETQAHAHQKEQA